MPKIEKVYLVALQLFRLEGYFQLLVIYLVDFVFCDWLVQILKRALDGCGHMGCQHYISDLIFVGILGPKFFVEGLQPK